MLQRLDEKAHLITVIRTYMEFPRDPDDEPILNLAIQEQADYIIWVCSVLVDKELAR